MRATCLAAAVISAALALPSDPGGAEDRDASALPEFAQCPRAAPKLPKRWRAIGLMSPFKDGQLDVGEFVHDGSLSATRATLYGLESGGVDLLITSGDTYRLTGPYDGPTGCASVGPQFRPFAERWMARRAQCAGVAPVMSKAVEWWKTPADHARANWIWYSATTRLPFRTMFATPSRRPAVIGDYAMTFFPTFEPVEKTGLAELVRWCSTQVNRAKKAVMSVRQTARELMADRNDAADAERPSRIQTLIPGLSHQACDGASAPQWPHRFGATAIMTPVSFDYGPFPTEMLYDWEGQKSQRTRMHQPQRPGLLPVLDGILKPGIGYDIRRPLTGAAACQPSYPGIIKPDWMSADRCACKGVVSHNAVLGPNEVIEIRSCPIVRPDIFWSWYTTAGRPVLFMEAAAEGDGLTLADYHRFEPGKPMPPAAFDLPPQCTAKDARPPATQAHNIAATAERCTRCHLAPDR